MTPKQFFELLHRLKDGDAVYLTIESKNGKLYCNNEEIENGNGNESQEDKRLNLKIDKRLHI